MADHFVSIGDTADGWFYFDGVTIDGVYYPEPHTTPPNYTIDPDALIYYYRIGGTGFNFAEYNATVAGAIGGTADGKVGDLGNIVRIGPIAGPATVTIHTRPHPSYGAVDYDVSIVADAAGSGTSPTGTYGVGTTGVDFTFDLEGGTPAPPLPPGIGISIGDVEFENLLEKRIRFEDNGSGSGSFVISRLDVQATPENLRQGVIVKVSVPEIHDDTLGEFLLEEGEFDLVASGEEGSEELAFSGPGTLAILRRARVHPVAEFDEPDAPASVVKLSEGVWRWVNQEPGDILERLIEEAVARGPLAAVTHTFTDNEDSAAVPWTSSGSWKEDIGADLYDAAMRLVAAGQMHVEMRPGLILDAYQSRGRDLTGTSFGPGVVRFVKGVNIVDEVGRSMSGALRASNALVHGDDGSWIDVQRPDFDPLEDPYVEIVVEVGSHDPDYMEAAGLRALGAREDAQEALIFAVRVPYPGTDTDEENGIYLPGPSWSDRGLFWIGDLVTLHTGTAEYGDYDNATFRVYAITLYEDATGHLADVIVELNAPWAGSGAADLDVDPVPASAGGTAGGTGGTTPHGHSEYQSAGGDRWKRPVDVATTGNVTIASGLNVGDTIDDITLTAEMRVLVRANTDESENGIYDVSASPSRSSDFDASDEIPGAVVLVLGGTANAGKAYRCENLAPPVVGTDDITFAEFGEGGSFSGDAGDIPITDPGGHFTGTDVEAALEELADSDIVLVAATSAHLGDTTDAHDASAISVLDSGGFLAATDVEAALAELATEMIAIVAVIDGGGSAITTGVKVDLQIPFDCTITGWSVLLDQSGSIVIDVWKDTEANYPPVVGDSITAAAKPTVTAATKNSSNTLTGWTTAVAAGDTLRFNVDSITTATRATLTLKATRT